MYGVPEEERLTAQQVLTAWERQLAELVLSENKTDDGRLFICRSVPFQDEQQYTGLLLDYNRCSFPCQHEQ